MVDMRKLYLDIDDTYVDTEEYLRKVLESNGIECDPFESVWEIYFRGIGEDLFREVLSDYSVIPKKIGAEDCLKILETEFEIVYCTCYMFEEERLAKLRMSEEEGREIIFCRYFDKSCVDMEDNVFVDDTPKHLVNSNLKSKNQYLMYNPYALDTEGYKYLVNFKGEVVMDWFSLCDKIMEVHVDDELRDSICSRVSKCVEKCRV